MALLASVICHVVLDLLSEICLKISIICQVLHEYIYVLSSNFIRVASPFFIFGSEASAFPSFATSALIFGLNGFHQTDVLTFFFLQMTSSQHPSTQAVRESYKLGKEMKLP